MVDDKEEDPVGKVAKMKWYYECFMWNTRVYKLAVFWGVRSERGLNHGLWQKYFHQEKIGKRERDGFYIAYFPIPWIFGFIKFNLALTVTWELQGQILAENVSFGARWNFKTATLWQTNWFFCEKKAEYSSWLFRFLITPSAMNSFLKIWEQFCDLSNLGSRVVARIDWGVCVCAIISGVVKLPLPLKTPARARTAKSSSVITQWDKDSSGYFFAYVCAHCMPS